MAVTISTGLYVKLLMPQRAIALKIGGPIGPISSIDCLLQNYMLNSTIFMYFLLH
ncbi:MAG: hypothetical protein HC849_34695 [Oscillatoriales cyanobacterium RU_3_3]|nr:hypothetical protein [Oscillatoriales cyanobacterium RU_3_3]